MARKFFPPVMPGDSARFREAVSWCQDNGITFERVSERQIKVQHLNYYPDRETVQFDGRTKIPQGTFELFKRLALQNREWRKGHLGKFRDGPDKDR